MSYNIFVGLLVVVVVGVVVISGIVFTVGMFLLALVLASTTSIVSGKKSDA